MFFRQVESHPMREAVRRIMKQFSLNAAVLVLLVVLFSANFCHAQDATRTIEIHAKRFAFSPAEITLKKGETVKLLLTSDDVTHSLVIPDLNVKEIMKKGHTTEVTITPTKAGDFNGKCGHFCGSGHGSMIFTVHVTDN
jgi:cytochrome c oxidase subunit 2